MNQMYGFEGEVKAKYTAQMFQLFSEVFQWLPLAQCINSKVLVSSGSVSSIQAQGRATHVVVVIVHQLHFLFDNLLPKSGDLVSFFREDFVKCRLNDLQCSSLVTSRTHPPVLKNIAICRENASQPTLCIMGA